MLQVNESFDEFCENCGIPCSFPADKWDGRRKTCKRNPIDIPKQGITAEKYQIAATVFSEYLAEMRALKIGDMPAFQNWCNDRTETEKPKKKGAN